MIPKKMGEVLVDGDLDGLPGTLNSDDRCQGAAFHSPNPLLVREVSLIDPAWTRATTLGPMVWLCPNCTDNLRVYQHLLAQTNGQLEWPVRREFGNLIRALGDRAWAIYTELLEAING